MAWYYYSGDSILAVSVGNGEVIAVRPHSTIFVDSTVESTAAFKRFGRVLRRTGAPKDAKSFVPAQPIAGKIVAPASVFSDSIVEGSKAVANGEDSPFVKALEKPVATAPVAADLVVDAAPAEVEEAVDEADDASVDQVEDEGAAVVTKRKRKFTS
jgi:hypothetical protein